MISRMSKRLVALVMACTVMFSQLPSVVFATANVKTSVVEAYGNDFSNGDIQLPNEVNGVITNEDVSIEEEMLKFQSKFDGTSGWDSNKHELNFYTDYNEKIKANSKIQFDILIPTESKEFLGVIKFKGALKDSSWNWQDGSLGDILASDFEDLDNGYSKVSVEATVSNEIDGIKAVVIQILSYECDYSDVIYLDNINVVEEVKDSEEVLPEVEALSWNFKDEEKGLSGWENGGSWDYKGNIDIAYDNDVIENGALKLTVDYSNNVETSWSEVKIQNNFSNSININGYNMLTYDFIYNPAAMTTGSFQTKLFINGAVDTYLPIKFENLEDVDGGLKKAKVTVKFGSANKDIDGIILGIIGANTDYKGDIFIDNIELSQEAAPDIYVEITEPLRETPSVVDINSLVMPENISLVDANSTDETSSLYSYLMGVGKSDKVIFGHQNDTHHKGGKLDGGTNSDTKDVTGSIAGLVGIDTLSFTGAELEGGVEAAANVSINAANEGGIVTLSCHMPNFQVVKNRELNSDGTYDYSGYSPGVTSGNIVERIMPDGDLNDVFTGYLDIIADYGLQLQEQGVPVLFRPFHENNGSWFWWGKAFCDEEAYKNLFRYTVEYLRDVKGVHNFLYVYSPNGPFEDEAEYLSRYPGDEFIDVIAFDMYHDNPTEDDVWMDIFKETIELVQGLANKRGKLSTVSETGMRVMSSLGGEDYFNGIADRGNNRLDWYNEVLDVVSGSDMPYFMVWANFDDKSNFYTPYKVSETKGHEMINNFIDFYNDDRSIFANGVGEFESTNVNVNEAYSYGFINNPVSGSRVLEETTIKASVKNLFGDITFVIKDNSNNVIETINAKKENDGIYTGEISKEILEKIGETIGTIELKSNNEVLNSIKVLFNMKETEPKVELVDDFEGYLGESAILENSWATNYGPGCNLKPTLSTEEGKFNSGKYGLAFNYKISTEKTNEGWAGMTIPKEVDWSEYDALQLWIKPDGNGQKLVIQITSNGEDFEVWLPELAATTEAQLITIPFSEFKGKNNGTFDIENIQRVGIWCNTIVPEDHEGVWTVESTMYFDDIKAVNTNDIQTPDPEPTPDSNPTPKPEPTPGEGDTEVTVPVKPGSGSNNDENNNGDKLPQTGGVNSSIFIVLAISLVGAGSALTKKSRRK